MTESAQPAPPILRTAVVDRRVEDAFAVFTEEIGAWWPLPTHSVFGERSGGVHFVDGYLVEMATDGSRSTWAEVLEWEPPNRFALAWHPGGTAGDANRVEVTFESDAAGTRVQVRHDGWEQFGQEGLRRRRGYVGPSAWGHVLDHYADGAELRSEPTDIEALALAYEQFFTEAEAGGFGPPADGGWDAEQVVAHVALNDLAMTAVAHGLVFRSDPAFENETCQDRGNLAAVVDSCGDWSELVAHGRDCARRAMAALSRLDAEQLTHPVRCRFQHDGVTVLEDPRPWGTIANDTQAEFHLPAHIDQLRNLRI